MDMKTRRPLITVHTLLYCILFYDRFGAKTMGASLAQSRLKTIEKLEAAAPEAPKVRK
jgi:hypothetical protein